MSSGGPKKFVEKLESVQLSAVRGPRAPDQRGGVEGPELFHLETLEQTVNVSVKICP